MNQQQEFQKEVQMNQGRDFSHNWVTSSAFLFYLKIACFIAFLFGASYMLSTKRFSKPEVEIQESTLYTPKYK